MKRSFEAHSGYPILEAETGPNAEMLPYSPYFTDQFGLGTASLAAPSVEGDGFMQDGLFSPGGIIDSVGSGVTLPTDFDWVSSITTSWGMIC